MKHSVLFVLGAVVATALSAAEPARPVYPLSVIVQGDPREGVGPRASLADTLAVVRMGYNDDGAPLRATRDARHGKQPPLIAYMGGFTSNHEDILWLEKEYRRGIAMTDVAKLGADLDATTREFTLTEPRGGELAVKASNADATDLNDRTRYAFWIRIDDELMKVLAVDEKTGRVTVERGFDRSAAVAHKAGAVVLSPIYLGDRSHATARSSNSFPGGTSRLRYATYALSPEAQAYKARCIVEMMRLGYDGAWWDTFQPQPFNLCDALGRKVDFPWNYAEGKRHDFRGMLEALKVYIRNVRALVRKEMGREPVIYGNSVSGTYHRGSKELMNDATTHDLLDGYCFEDSYLDVKPLRNNPPFDKANGPRNGTFQAFGPRDPAPPPAVYGRVTGTQWLRNVRNQADAARVGSHALCMVGAAGYLGGRFNPELPDYADLLRYSYASYLLTVTSERTTSFGLPLLVQLNRQHGGKATAEPWPALLFAPIGEPAQPNDIEALKVKDTLCYARAFTNGFVAVYPEEKGEPVNIAVPAGLVDAESGQPVASLRLAPGQAAVLIKKQG